MPNLQSLLGPTRRECLSAELWSILIYDSPPAISKQTVSSLFVFVIPKIRKLSLLGLQYASTTSLSQTLLGVVFRNVQFAAQWFENKRPAPSPYRTIGVLGIEALRGIEIGVLGHLLQKRDGLPKSATNIS